MLTMTATHKSDPARWLVCLGPDDQIYAYVQETNQFHYSYPLDMDYRWDFDFTYLEVTSLAAAQLISEGVDFPSGLRAGAQKRLVDSGSSLSVEEVLGDAAAFISREAT